MKYPLPLFLCLLSVSLITADSIPGDAKQVTPIEVGDDAPNPTLRTMKGERVTLEDVRKDDPTIVVFYRGGWCPYCNRHLSELQTIQTEIKNLGWTMVAISPDNPEHLNTTLEEQKLSYTLLSDSKMNAAKSFGVAFQVDTPTVKKLDQYGIDLIEASGMPHQQLPVPAVFLINAEGKITYVYMEPDYKKRLSSEVLLKHLDSK